MTARWTRRLTKEYNEILKDSNFEVILSDDNLKNWEVRVKVQDGTKLKENKIDYVYFKVEFPDEYPSVAPKVMIIKPYIEAQFIFDGGAICSDIFFKAGWSPMYNNINILNQMIQLLENGFRNVNLERSYDNSKYDSQMEFISKAHSSWKEHNN